jgi:2'-5' RNA ligase
LFFAFPLSETEKVRFADYIDLGKEQYPGLKWVKPSNLHLTLHFLGEMDSAQADECVKLLDHPDLGGPEFSLSYEGYGRFPPKGIPRVLFIHLTDGVDECSRIHGTLGELIRPITALDRRPFSPHITVARVKGRMDVYPDVRKLECPSGSLEIRSIVLYESLLKPEGAVYRELARVDLQVDKRQLE